MGRRGSQGIVKHRRLPCWGSRLCERRSQANTTCGLPASLTGLTTWFTRLGLIDRKGTAREFRTLELRNSGFRRIAVGHLDEPKAFGAARIAVDNNTNLVHHAILLKELAKVLIGGAVRQIANKDVHGVFPCGREDKQSPSHPNSMQKQYRGEATRDNTGSRGNVLLSRMARRIIP